MNSLQRYRRFETLVFASLALLTTVLIGTLINAGFNLHVVA